MRVHGVVVVDLTRLRLDSKDAASTAKAALWRALCDTPAGADVRLIAPRWDWWCPFAAQALLEMGTHVASVVVESTDPDAVRNWVVALRQEIRANESVMDR